jgi:sporulation protein YpjB
MKEGISMKQKLGIGCLVLLILGIGTQFFHSPIVADHSDISSTAFQYLRLMEEQRYKTAEAVLKKHEDEILSMVNDNKNSRVGETVHYLYEENVKNLNHSSINDKQLYHSALSLTLMLDAINKSGEHAAWNNWESELRHTIATLIDKPDRISHNEINKVLTYWEILSPAFMVALTDKEYEQISTAYQQLQTKNGENITQRDLEQVFRQMKMLDITNTNSTKKQNSAFVLVILIVGGFITMTLSYVAWKKYKGDKNIRRKTEENS